MYRINSPWALFAPTVTSTIDFVEFARRKLTKTLKQHVIQTKVILTGDIVLLDADFDSPTPEKVPSEESFFKVRMDVKSISSMDFGTVSREASRTHQPNMKKSSIKMLHKQDKKDEQSDNKTISYCSIKSNLGSVQTTRSFRNQKSQVDVEDRKVPEVKKEPMSLPAVFEGTMTTPVLFNGTMLTPGDLDKLLNNAFDSDSIPVTFQGAMMSSLQIINPRDHFKQLKAMTNQTKTDNAQGESGTDNHVKLNGQLQGALNNLPVVFEGNLLGKNAKE